MPRFTLRSLMIATAGLMAYTAILAQFPIAVLISLSIPAFCALLFMPYLSLRLLAIFTDPKERTFKSDQLQNTLWTLFFCLLALAPLISLVATHGYRYVTSGVLQPF